MDQARSDWLAGKMPAKKLDTRDWMTPQWQYFLDGMPGPLRKEQLAELDQAFGFMRSGNALVSRSWLMLVIRSAYTPGYPRLEEYLQSIGRRKLIEPLYEELMKTPAGAAMAKRVFAAGAARLSRLHRRCHRCDRQPCLRGCGMTSEWMKVMLEEIARKKSEAEQAQIEQALREPKVASPLPRTEAAACAADGAAHAATHADKG